MTPARRRVLGAIGVALLASVVLRAPDAAQLLQFTVLGVAAGAVYAIAASGVVLTYTTTGVFNFAHGAVGMLAAFGCWQLREEWGVPAPLAVLLILGVAGPLVGLVLERASRGLRGADVGTSIVLTIAVTVLCIGVSQYAWKPNRAHNLDPVIGGTVRVLGATVTWDDVLKVAAAAAIAVGLRWLLFRTRTGTTMRAVVDSPSLAALHGASSTAVARGSWILGTELAMVASILIGSGTNLEAIVLTFVVVNAYGAAVLGRLRSLPLTFAGAIGLGLVQSWGTAFWFPRGASSFALADGEHWRRIALSLPGLFLFVALLLLPQAHLGVGRRRARRMPAVPSLYASLVRAAAFVAVALVVADRLPEAGLGDVTRAVVFAVILLSLVVLTGYSGQVSLAQYVFVALGAWAMGSWFGGSSPLGLVAAAVVPVGLAVVVALPALRLQGLHLALVTFGFAAVSRDLLIQDPVFFGGPPVNVGRPTLLGISFEGDRAFLVLCSVVFALLGVGVLALRRGELGRRFAAVRDSEAACATLGLDPRRTRLLAFCLSAAIAGIGGALFGGSQLTVADTPFEPINNVVLFLFAVVGGATTVSGALVGGALFALLPYVQSHHPDLAGLVFAGIAAVAVSLGRHPDGLAGIAATWLTGLRRALPRLPRHRGRGAVVPVAVVLAGVLVVAGARPAIAQGADPTTAYGGLNATARAGGVQVSYDVEGVLPLPPPLLQATVPTARSTTATGPSSLAFGSLAYPGDLVGNLPSLVEQSAPGSGGSIPPYPIATLAEHPSGPATNRQDLATASAQVAADERGATATATLAGSDLPGVVAFGTVTTSTRTGVEDGAVAARSRSEVAGASLLYGLIRLEGVVTDVVAATDGDTGRTGGTTAVAAASVLGIPVTIGPDGVAVQPRSRPDDLGPLTPLADVVDQLGATADPAAAAVATLAPVLQEVLGPATGSLDQLLAAAGIRLTAGAVTGEARGAAASVDATGVRLRLTFDGTEGPLAALLALLPSDVLPGEGLPGAPVNTSPQALVNLLKERHITEVALAPAVADVDASPALDGTTSDDGRLALDDGFPSLGGGDDLGFTTPLPDLGRRPVAATGGRPGGLVPGRAVAPVVVLGLLATLPFWGRGAGRLMDAALGGGATGCEVAGFDGPVRPGGERGDRGS